MTISQTRCSPQLMPLWWYGDKSRLGPSLNLARTSVSQAAVNYFRPSNEPRHLYELSSNPNLLDNRCIQDVDISWCFQNLPLSMDGGHPVLLLSFRLVSKLMRASHTSPSQWSPHHPRAPFVILMSSLTVLRVVATPCTLIVKTRPYAKH